MSQLAIYLFGPPRVTLDGVELDIRRRKAIALLAYLAITQLPYSRDVLATLFWPNYGQTDARANLRRTLSSLHQALDHSWLALDRTTVRLRTETNLWVDANHFQQLLAKCRGHVHPADQLCDACLQRLTEVTTLYTADFLAGFTLADSPDFDDWQAYEAEQLHGALAGALMQLGNAYHRQGDYLSALPYTRRRLLLDPLDEPAHRHLMQLYAQTGQQAAALRQYQQCCEILATELDLLPAEETTILYERIRTGEFVKETLETPSISGQGVPTRPSHADQLHLPIEIIPEPGPLPAGSIMPLSKNPLFVGRAQALRVLAESLQLGDTAAVSQVETAATTGLGGIGKTQLASEFVHRYGQFFPGGVFWLSFDNADSVPAEIAACGGVGALELRPDFEQRPLTEQLRLVQAAWQAAVPRLLIFDNCEELALLTRWRPTSGGCRIIITSRRGDWEPALGVKMVALGVLSRAESLALLRSHAPDADEELLDALAEELGDLPLALHLAGSYLRRYPHVEPDRYLTQLRDPQLLQHPSMAGQGFSPTGHMQHVGRTFALSYDRLKPQDETDAQAIKLLVHAAHFAPGEPIWYRLLVKTLGLDLADPTATLQADSAFARLIELGIIERETNDSLRMHRLVARFVRDVAGEQVAATQKAVEAIVFAETAQMNKQVRPLPLLAWQLHLRSVADVAKVREDEEGARLCHELGMHLWQIGDFDGALPYVEKALTIREQRLGARHLSVAESLTLMGRLYRAMGQYTASKLYFDRALAIRLHHLGESHAQTAESLENLGRCFHELGLLDEARQHLQRALAIYRQVLGDEHELTAECYNNLAHCLYSMADRAGALLHLERAAAINERVLGPTHPHVAVNYHNIGAVLHVMGKLDEAKSYIERALSIRRAVYGDEHPDTAISLERMGQILRDLKELDQAKAYIEQALAFYLDRLGEQHVTTANCHSSMATVLRHQGKITSAIVHQEQAYHVCCEMLGPEHQTTQNKLRYLQELRTLQE